MQTQGQAGKNKGHSYEQETRLKELSLDFIHELIILFAGPKAVRHQRPSIKPVYSRRCIRIVLLERS
jgi:hypothetical protein